MTQPQTDRAIRRALRAVSRIALAAAAATSAFACVTFTVVEGNGVAASETREHAAFDQVTFAGFLDGEVERGEPREVEITCDENLLAHFSTRVEEGALVVETARDVWLQPATPCSVRVRLPTLVSVRNRGSGTVVSHEPWVELASVRNEGAGEIELAAVHVEEALVLDNSGSGTVAIEDVEAYEVGLSNGGSGDVWLSGRVSVLSVDNGGTGEVFAAELAADEVSVALGGSGHVEVRAEQAIRGTIGGSGRLTVLGDPSVRDVVVEGPGAVAYR